MNKIITVFHPNLKTKIKVYCDTQVSDTIDIDLIFKCLSEIRDNVNTFISDKIFSDLTIEVYNKDHDLKPNNLICGLTYFGLNLIQLSNWQAEYNYQEYFSRLVSHEFGHYMQSKLNENVKKNFAESIYYTIANKESKIISSTELFAELFMYSFGSKNAKGFLRGAFTPSNQIKGFKGLLYIYQNINNFINSLPFNRYISNLNIKYSELNNDYISVEIETRNIFFWFDAQKVLFEYRN